MVVDLSSPEARGDVILGESWDYEHMLSVVRRIESGVRSDHEGNKKRGAADGSGYKPFLFEGIEGAEPIDIAGVVEYRKPETDHESFRGHRALPVRCCRPPRLT